MYQEADVSRRPMNQECQIQVLGRSVDGSRPKMVNIWLTSITGRNRERLLLCEGRDSTDDRVLAAIPFIDNT
jgi:hypothetical protein